jgi:hypothetical protein
MARYGYASAWGDAYTRTLLTDWEQPNKVVVETQLDLPFLEANNNALADEQPTNATNKLVARVPMTVYEKSIHENWDDDDWARYLNSADARPFRVWKGRV